MGINLTSDFSVQRRINMNHILHNKRVLLYGARSNPLSYFLSRRLNTELTANNVFVADTSQSMEQNRMPADKKFECNEMVVKDEHSLIDQIERNDITNIIDMTNGTLLKNKEVQLEEQLPRVNIVTPIFAGNQKSADSLDADVRQAIN